MKTVLLIQDLVDHNDWANLDLLARCEQLTDHQLDQPREMGFGTLRNILFHILEAEKLWLGRWQDKPWRPLATDSEAISPGEIARETASVAKSRNLLIEAESKTGFNRVVEFYNSQRVHSAFPIGDLMLHVANHGIHHRAQVLNFLREHTQTIPRGVDYIFWKLARPSCELPAESVKSYREHGLEIDTQPGNIPGFEQKRICQYFQYTDWAMQQVINAAARLDEAKLDQEFAMGMGTLRKTLQHLIDAERWWQTNWRQEESPFPQGEPARTLSEMVSLYNETAAARNRFVESLDDDAANKVLSVYPGGPELRIRVIESLIQLCGHGTHHRAQALNMLRQLGVRPPAIDLIVWLRVS